LLHTGNFLGYLNATATENCQTEFKVFRLVEIELHFVWSLSANLPGIGTAWQTLTPASSTDHGSIQTFPWW